MSLNEELNKLFANTREHAPYFAIGDKDRANRWNSEIREFSEVYERSPLLRGIVGKWEEIKSVNQRGRNSEKSDPPDVEVIKRDGQRFGIEVTEFVNCKSIRSGEKGIAELPCEWTEDLFRATMLERISRKDTGWPEFFDCRILLLLCDELELRLEDCRGYVSNLQIRVRHFDIVLLVFSPLPGLEELPVLSIKKPAGYI